MACRGPGRKKEETLSTIPEIERGRAHGSFLLPTLLTVLCTLAASTVRVSTQSRDIDCSTSQTKRQTMYRWAAEVEY